MHSVDSFRALLTATDEHRLLSRAGHSEAEQRAEDVCEALKKEWRVGRERFAHGETEQESSEILTEQDFLALWRVLQHHWSQADSDEPGISLRVMIQRLRRHQGRRRIHSVGDGPGSFADLGGNPLNDMVLFRALLASGDEAAGCFIAEYEDAACRVFRGRGFSDQAAPGLWQHLAATLIVPEERRATDGSMEKSIRLRFSGTAGLARVIHTAAARYRPRNADRAARDEMRHLTAADRLEILEGVLSGTRGTADADFSGDDDASRSIDIRVRLRNLENSLTPTEWRQYDVRRDAARSRSMESVAARINTEITDDDAERRDCRHYVTHRLRNSLQRMTDSDRQILLLDLWRRMPNRHIASYMQLTESATDHRRRKARAQFSRFCQGADAEGDAVDDSLQDCLDLLRTEFSELIRKAYSAPEPGEESDQ